MRVILPRGSASRVIVDTSVWIDYLNGRETKLTDWLDHHLDGWPLGLLDIILCEVLQGFRDDAEFELVSSRLQAIQVHSTGGMDFALDCAANYRRLRSLGNTVRKTVDCWIATFCLRNDFFLLHSDRDFDAFEEHLGLKVLHV